jgi:electron transfer flavoprotein alpha subunit
MLTLARELAANLETSLAGVIIGDQPAQVADQLGGWGLETIYLVEDARLDEYAPDAWAGALVQLMKEKQPEAVMAIGSDWGNEVLARAAARANLPLAANCVEIQPEGDAYFVTRVRWGGTVLEEARLHGAPKLLTVAPFAVEAVEADGGSQPEVVTVTPALADADLRVRVTARIAPQREGVSLAEAPVVVAGGRGVDSAEGFESLDELAALLGGAVGCSRVVTNNGWRPHADQVGQTGVRVAPELYIACGISGASQHMAGCTGSKHILVINNDPEAPILAQADYAIIGDLHEVLPAISEAVRARQG